MSLPRLSIDPFDEAFLIDPTAHHPALRDAGAVVWLDAIGCYAMARYDEVKAALGDPATFCSSRGVGLADFTREEPWRPLSLLLEADPPLHARTRGLMNRIVSLKSLKELRPLWREQADTLIEDLVTRGHFDAVIELGETYPIRVFPDAVGVPVAGREHLLTYAAGVFNAFGPRNAVFARGEAAAVEAAKWVAHACKRDSLTPGSWGAAIHDAADRGECTQQEAERLVRSLLSAGVDTTVNGIGTMMLAFAHFPSEWTKTRARPELGRRALDESLRWDSTVQTFFRTTTRDVAIGATVIPCDAKVILFLGAANRDPRRWEAPDRFDLDRMTSGHVGFGFGIHQCLGQMIARMEVELLIEAMIPRIAEIRPVGAPVRRLNNTLHALASLPVAIIPA